MKRKNRTRAARVVAAAERADARPSTPPGDKLVNNLTVEDARHLIACEGGPMSAGLVAHRAVSIAVGLALTAWAISQHRVTAWHLLLPMVALYLVVLVVLPVVYLVLRTPGLKKDAVGSVRLLALLLAVGAAAVGVQAHRSGRAWDAVLAADAAAAWRWVADAGMQWAILWCVADGLYDLLSVRVRNLYRFGPPFVGVSLGCAMRFGLLLLGVALIPVVASTLSHAPAWWPWLVWAWLGVAEFAALAMHWDLQTRLAARDAG